MNVTAMLTDDLDRKLRVAAFAPLSPEGELEKVADVHRRCLAKYKQRCADTRRALKATVSTLEADKKTLKARFEMDMANLQQQIADAKERAAVDIEADRQLAASSQAALDVLAAE